jgi:hypothetical protein|tara:strand:- start:476 stop:598 length:123 start_codon:yes stop_codon:yes gene_type:complete
MKCHPLNEVAGKNVTHGACGSMVKFDYWKGTKILIVLLEA